MQQATPSNTPTAPGTPAGLALRLAALTYDGLLLLAIYFITIAVVGRSNLAAAGHQHDWADIPQSYRHFVLMPSLFLVTYLFYGYFWRKHGQTLGMQTWRLRALRQDGMNLGWGDGLARMLVTLILPTLCGTASWLLQGPMAAGAATLAGFFCNYLWIYTNPERLALHDQLTHTRIWRVPPPAKKAG